MTKPQLCSVPSRSRTLEQQEADLVSAHIAQCDRCAPELARYIEIVHLLDER